MKPHWSAKLAVLILFIALLSVIVYKAVYLPITYDEMSASVYYPTFSVIDIIKYPGDWPSNHVLNSLCIKLTESVFGIEPWSVRLPNILAFVLLFGVLYQLASRYFYRSAFLFFLPFVIIFSNPYLLDFFGLARGYGMSNALMATSVYCLLRYSSSLKWSWFFLTAIFSMLAAYANFTLLIFWVAVHALLAIIFIGNCIKRRQFPSVKAGFLLFIALLLAGGFAAICYSPVHRMQATNQFVYWSKNSFFTDTLLDTISRFQTYTGYFGISAFFIACVVIVLLSITTLIVLGKIMQKGFSAFSQPLVLLFVLLVMVWSINMMQTIILGTPYLNGRTALSYFVLFGFVLMFLLLDMSESMIWARNWLVPVVALMFFIHLSLSIRLNQVIEWAFDANTYQVINYLDNYRKEHPVVKTIDLNTTWLFSPSFSFYTITGKTPWLELADQHMNIDTASTTLFYYSVREDTSRIRNYSPVLSFGKGDRVLMIKK